MGHKDLKFGQIVYILAFYNISFSWLLPLDGFQFIFLCRVYCVTVKTIYYQHFYLHYYLHFALCTETCCMSIRILQVNHADVDVTCDQALFFFGAGVCECKKVCKSPVANLV